MGGLATYFAAETLTPLDLERTFAFLFEQLNVNGTADHIDRFVEAPLQHHAALKPVFERT